jgi:hypothetical protein
MGVRHVRGARPDRARSRASLPACGRRTRKANFAFGTPTARTRSRGIPGGSVRASHAGTYSPASVLARIRYVSKREFGPLDGFERAPRIGFRKVGGPRRREIPATRMLLSPPPSVSTSVSTERASKRARCLLHARARMRKAVALRDGLGLPCPAQRSRGDPGGRQRPGRSSRRHLFAYERSRATSIRAKTARAR